MFDLIVDFLPVSWRPRAKAIVALLTPLITFCLLALVSGEWDVDTLKALIIAVITGGAVERTPNREA